MHSPELSRRQALKWMGTGLVAAASAPVLSPLLRAEDGPVKKEDPQPFLLPSLPYEYAALEPFIDARTMELHHSMHHQAYIDAANRALAEYPDLMKLTAEQILRDLRVAPESLRTLLRNQLGGHVNHSLFWTILSPKPARQPGRALASAIDKSFGSFDGLKTRLQEASMRQFGSGWAWLCVDTQQKLSVFNSPNQDSPIMMGLTPILGLDVWEHAYYLKHENRRQEYLTSLFQVIDWSAVSRLHEKAKAPDS